ncbi:MAG: site-2 protease family protein [Polyangiaceae bacterium]
MSSLPEFVVWYLVFVFSTTCHEAAHAFAALKGGDRTAYSMGQVTLDPLPHIKREPIGMVIVPILSFQMGMMIGWASTPFDPSWGARYPRRWALMSFAGPLTNFVLAALALIAIKALASAGVFSLSAHHGGVQVGLVQLAAGHEFTSPLGALALALSALLKLERAAWHLQHDARATARRGGGDSRAWATAPCSRSSCACARVKLRR